jgi:hypothetical protein
VLNVGQDVATYGFYSHGGGWSTLADGAFKGHVVSFRTETHTLAAVSFPIVEGLSGSPLRTAHHGSKVVGVCFGSEAQRVVASEVLEYEDREVKLKETVNRIVEFGLAYRVEEILGFLAEIEEVDPLVTAEQLDEPELT